MKTRTEVILSIYESCENGVIDEETRDALLEACDKTEEDCEDTKEDSEKEESNNEEDEIVEYKKKIEELKEKIKKAESKKAIEKIKEKAKDSMEELADVADDEDIEDKLEELYDEFIDSVDEDDEEEEENIEERVNEVCLSIYESCENGYITEEVRDELLTIVNESLYDTIKKAAENGKKVLKSDSLKGLSPDYKIDGLTTGLQMMKQGKLEQAEKEKRASELRKRVALATANAGVGN